MKKKCKYLICIYICVGFGFMANAQTELDVVAFEALSQKPNVQIIDVRTKEEFGEGHLVGAQNIDVFDDNFAKNLGLLKKKMPVLLYCYSGGRSSEAAQTLVKLGFNKVYELKGGLSAWRKLKKPISK